MKLWHCTGCHHEWQGPKDTCDWCGRAGTMLKETKPIDFSFLTKEIIKKNKYT